MKDEASLYSTNVTSVNVTLSFVAINIGVEEIFLACQLMATQSCDFMTRSHGHFGSRDMLLVCPMILA